MILGLSGLKRLLRKKRISDSNQGVIEFEIVRRETAEGHIDFTRRLLEKIFHSLNCHRCGIFLGVAVNSSADTRKCDAMKSMIDYKLQRRVIARSKDCSLSIITLPPYWANGVDDIACFQKIPTCDLRLAGFAAIK